METIKTVIASERVNEKIAGSLENTVKVLNRLTNEGHDRNKTAIIKGIMSDGGSSIGLSTLNTNLKKYADMGKSLTASSIFDYKGVTPYDPTAKIEFKKFLQDDLGYTRDDAIAMGYKSWNDF
jgi:hypothetical protein